MVLYQLFSQQITRLHLSLHKVQKLPIINYTNVNKVQFVKFFSLDSNLQQRLAERRNGNEEIFFDLLSSVRILFPLDRLSPYLETLPQAISFKSFNLGQLAILFILLHPRVKLCEAAFILAPVGDAMTTHGEVLILVDLSEGSHTGKITIFIELNRSTMALRVTHAKLYGVKCSLLFGTV